MPKKNVGNKKNSILTLSDPRSSRSLSVYDKNDETVAFLTDLPLDTLKDIIDHVNERRPFRRRLKLSGPKEYLVSQLMQLDQIDRVAAVRRVMREERRACRGEENTIEYELGDAENELDENDDGEESVEDDELDDIDDQDYDETSDDDLGDDGEDE